jgi:hypothetical protein
MKRILFALVALAAVSFAACRIYDVDVYQNVNTTVPGDPGHGVSQSFTCTADSLLWAEFFVGAANDTGTHYEFSILPVAGIVPLYMGEAQAGPSVQYEYVRAYLTPSSSEPLIKGETYVLKVTHSNGDPINFYYNPSNIYPYGSLEQPEQPNSADLCARIEGINRPVSREYMAANGELYSMIDAPVHVLDPLDKLMDTVGIGWDRELWPWHYIQFDSVGDSSFHWRIPDSVMKHAALNHIKVLPVLGATPPWASTHFDLISNDSTSNNDTVWSLGCPPRNLFEPVEDTLGSGCVNPNQFWGRFVYEAIMRYGPGGTFWTDTAYHGLTYLPITEWEVWNEPNVTGSWEPPQVGYDNLYATHRSSGDTIPISTPRARRRD